MSSEFISNPQRAARTDVVWGSPGGPVVKTACSNAETEIGSLVEKLRSHTPCSAAKKRKKKKKGCLKTKNRKK